MPDDSPDAVLPVTVLPELQAKLGVLEGEVAGIRAAIERIDRNVSPIASATERTDLRLDGMTAEQRDIRADARAFRTDMQDRLDAVTSQAQRCFELMLAVIAGVAIVLVLVMAFGFHWL
jgi:CHASE3 domain sensor protein